MKEFIIAIICVVILLLIGVFSGGPFNKEGLIVDYITSNVCKSDWDYNINRLSGKMKSANKAYDLCIEEQREVFYGKTSKFEVIFDECRYVKNKENLYYCYGFFFLDSPVMEIRKVMEVTYSNKSGSWEVVGWSLSDPCLE